MSNQNKKESNFDANLKFSLRFCYSKTKFMDSLITDIDALISKEREYMEYLDGCMFSINYIIVRT